MDADPRRRIPRTDVVLADPRLHAAARRWGRPAVKQAVLAAQQAARTGAIPPEAVPDAAVERLPRAGSSLRPVLNATGVLLHTNLGRAPLASVAVDALVAAAGYVDVEYDLGTGRRASRGAAARAALLAAVPAAEDALVVNNGAAALALAAATLAAGREVVVSRGELIEIGDGFRLPDLLTAAGARLREVGTTNRTTVADYAAAVGPDTGMLLKVHTANFVMHGFTAAVDVTELAGLGPPVVADLGSGLLAADRRLPAEPDAASWLAAGAGLVSASGDKLLGGPQAGLLLGRRALVERLRRHPLARAVRVDKLTLAALEASVRCPDRPVHRALHADPGQLRARAEALAGELARHGLDVTVVPTTGVVGGGGAPGVRLPGWAVSLPAGHAAALRGGSPPVIGRVEGSRCLLDLRCVPPAADQRLLAAVLAGRPGGV